MRLRGSNIEVDDGVQGKKEVQWMAEDSEE
jgi:hypothetical protein